jgi:hypothetical protein
MPREPPVTTATGFSLMTALRFAACRHEALPH